jgi:putative membrane protein
VALKFDANGLARWLNSSVFGVWTLALLYLVVGQRYTAFLRPGFGLLLALAHFTAMAFMIAAMTGQHPQKMHVSGLLRALILLLPLLYLVIMPDTGLDGSAFKNRYIGPSEIGTDQFIGLSRKNPQALRMQTQPAAELGPKPTGVQDRTILELFVDPMRYQGQRVTFAGMVMRDAKLKQYFGESDTAVYRFLMTCCAADALPLAIALEPGRAAALANDQWVQVEGDFQLHRMHDKSVPVVENAVVKKIDAPEAQYLFLTGSIYRR